MRLGIIDQSTPGWTAGEHYTRMLLSCLALANQPGIGDAGSHATEIVLFRGNENIKPPSGIRLEELVYVDRRTLQVNGRALESFGLDVVFPARENCVDTLRLPGMGWIPDFQHYTHSEFFSELDFVSRSVYFNAIAEKYPLVLLSSECAKHDFVEFLPQHSDKARVARFTSSLWTANLDDRPQDALSKYHLPEKYVLVANQFWLHKNHKILPPALSIARDKGLKIPLVLTGVPADYRDPENQLVSDLLQEFARGGLADQVHFLGKLPFRDLISVTRCAAVIVQPSMCEGWNTLIEDAKALGRPIICSDIEVHREQAPSALGHFSPGDPGKLAEILLDRFPYLDPGPCLSLEAERLALTRERAQHFGNIILGCAREVFEQQRKKYSVTPRRNNYLYQKQQHALYLWGKLKFSISKMTRSLVKRESDEPLSAGLIASLKQRLDGGYTFDYWKLSQYAPRAFQAEVFPRWHLEASNLPSLAIVTPSLNQADLVRATIESVLAQGYPNLRYAVVDGGSTDGSLDAINAEKEHLAYFVSEKDGGQCDAIRKGFRNISGDVMAYLNSDDLLMPGALLFVGEYFALHPEVDVIYGHRVIIDADGNEIGRRFVPPHTSEALGYFDFIPQETMFWRKRIYERVGGLDPAFHFALDWDLILRFVEAGARFRRVPYFLGCFRSHTEQKSATIHETVGADEIRILQRRELSEEPSPEAVARVSEKFARRAHSCRLLMQHGMRA
jgi:glycosyltransferase involved in cell wall biosynthesis